MVAEHLDALDRLKLIKTSPVPAVPITALGPWAQNPPTDTLDPMPDQRNGTRFAIKCGGAELIPELKPPWDALFDHHLSTGAAGIPTIPADQSWPLRRAHYERLAFAQTDLTIWLATDRVGPAGYALCYRDSGDPGPGFGGEWASTSDTVLETLVVVPRARGTGLGSELTDRFEANATQSHTSLAIVDVMGGNEPAAEFYRHRGYLPRSETWMRVRVPASGSHPTAPLPELATTALTSTVTQTGFNLELMPGPDDTWVTPDRIASITPLPGTSHGPVDKAGLVELLDSLEASGLWAVQATIPSSPAAGPVRGLLRAVGFKVSTERLARRLSTCGGSSGTAEA